jgi:hypothetical protein
VTSNLAPKIQISDDGRGHDGSLHSDSPRAKSFVSRILVGTNILD